MTDEATDRAAIERRMILNGQITIMQALLAIIDHADAEAKAHISHNLRHYISDHKKYRAETR